MTGIIWFIGLAGVPGDAALWISWIESIGKALSGDAVRTTLVLGGLSLLLWSWDVPKKVKERISNRSGRSAPEMKLAPLPTIDNNNAKDMPTWQDAAIEQARKRHQPDVAQDEQPSGDATPAPKLSGEILEFYQERRDQEDHWLQDAARGMTGRRTYAQETFIFVC